MRIGIDISQSAYPVTGVGRFTTGLIETISESSSDEWVFFFSALRSPLPVILERSFPSHLLKRLPLPPTALSVLWNSLHLIPVETFTGPLDWFITSDWTEAPARCKKATIVHDLVFMKYPETVDPKVRSVQAKRLKWVQKESTVLFADSEATKQDILKHYPPQSGTVIVNYPGVSVMSVTKEDILDTKKKYHLTLPYIIAVGKQEPRKNYDRLIQAFNSLTLDDVDLVIVGPRGWQNITSQGSRVRVIGQVTDKELFSLYRGSQMMIFPSLYEGFGYPLVEAMAMGVATACSQSSSLYEIGKNASYLFDPTSVEEIAQAMKELLTNQNLRLKLAHEGKERASIFTWQRYYNKMITALRSNV